MSDRARRTPARRLAGLLRPLALVLLALTGWPAASRAATPASSYTGSFAQDDDKRLFYFTLSAPGSVNLRTFSYAGGRNGAGTAIPAGGFDPTISVFDSNGNLIGSNGDGGCGQVPSDPVTSNCWDSFLTLSLPAGSYQVVLTQSDNLANGPTLGDSFVYDGQHTFTIGPESTGAAGFWDDSDSQRTSAFALDIAGATTSEAQLLISQTQPPSGQVASPYSYTFSATGGVQPFSWSAAGGSANLPPGLSLSAAGVLSGTPTAYGTYNFSLTVTDSSVPQMSATFAFQVVVIPQTLSITTSSLPGGEAGVSYGPVTLSEIGGYPPYTWSFQGTPPPASVAGLTLTAAGVLSGAPSLAGALTIPVKITDAQSNVATAQLAWQVNAAVSITSFSAPAPAVTGQSYAGYQFNGTGGNGGLSWSVVGNSAPPGMSVSSGGFLQGTPTAKGTYSVTVRLSDGFTSAQQTVTIVVYDPLTVTTSLLPAATVNQPYGPVQVVAAGGSGSYSFAASGLPSNLTMSSGGQISGTPGAAGTFPVSITLTDATAVQTASAQLSLVVAYTALKISSSGSLGGFGQGAAISTAFAANGGEAPYTWSAGGLPSSLSLNSGSGALTGQAAQPGNFSFSVQASDAQTPPFTATLTVSYTVLGITTTSLPKGTTQATYSAGLTANGGSPPYSWTASGLPAGMSLSSAGALGGTPGTAGTYPVSVTVTDSKGLSSTAGFSLLVIAAPIPLSVSSSMLTDPVVNQPYTAAVSAVGGTSPYTWSIVAGSLPGGLSMDSTGAISGTPATAGTASFTAQVTDKTGARASGAITLTVDPSPLTLSLGTLPDGVVGTDYPAQIFSPAGGTAPYSFSIGSGSLPTGLTLTGNQISGTPSANGTFSFTLIVTDSQTPVAQTVTIPLSILVAPANADLILSESSVSFSLAAPATSVPLGANLTIRSSVVLQLLNYSVSMAPAVPWLTVSSVGTTTPGSLGVALNSAALSLAAAATPYQTAISVVCIAPSPCAGHVQTVSVSLSVTAPPPQLSVSPGLLSFLATTASPAPPAQTLGIQNIGGGSLAIQSVTAADSWVTLSGVPTSVSSGPTVNVVVGVNAASLTPGFYRSTISVVSAGGSASVPVTLQFSSSGTMSLAPGGLQFSMPAGGALGNPNASFLVVPSGAPSVGWSASRTSVGGGNWLNLAAATGTSTPNAPGSVQFSIDPVVAAGLKAGSYYATIQVTSGDVSDSPVNETVVLSVTPANVQVRPNPQPAGFSVARHATDPSYQQTIQVFASSATAIPYQASATTTDGNPWLSVSPQQSTTSASSPDPSTVTVSAANLTPGVYYGGVSYAFSSAAVRTVNVTLVVQAAAPGPASGGQSSANITRLDTTSCTPTLLVPTQTGLVNNFAQPTAWPTALTIKVIDNCGSSVNGGQVVATFSNGDPPLPLRQTDTSSGVYSGTWTPRATNAQVTVLARATATGFAAATTQITGQVTQNAAPLLTPNGTVHAFAPQVGASVGQGNIVAIYGQNLAAQASSATATPLPTTLGGTQVIIGGIPVPLYYSSPSQINAQIPYELASGHNYQVVVNANGALSTPDGVQVADVAPGIAAFASGQIIAVHLDASLITEASPAQPGEVIVFYLAGLGVTNTAIASGVAAPFTQLLLPVDPPTLTLNGIPEPVAFAGLSPGFVGLYQINFQVPATAPSGDLTLVVSQPGANSNTVILPVGSPGN